MEACILIGIVNMQRGEKMSDLMTFPDTVDEFMEQYKIVDTEHVYTNGAELVPIFRMKQWFEHSAQPDIDEWCTDCKEYDSERHCCPRWNRVIRETLKDAQPERKWIPCSERLPKINQRVLFCSNGGTVFIGSRAKPDIVWQVTEADGRKHWVYDPEAYTDDIDDLPKAEDCSFDDDSRYAEGMLSTSSINYDPKFEGVIAWMPLPTPRKEDIK